MKRSIVVFIISLLIIPLITAGCGSNNKNDIVPAGQIKEMIWETSGGGELWFTVKRKGVDFTISVESYSYESIDKIILLTDNDPDVYDLVNDIFDQVLHLDDYTFTPQGTTGTWTTITLIYGDNSEVEFNNIRSWDDLSLLYHYVEDNI